MVLPIKRWKIESKKHKYRSWPYDDIMYETFIFKHPVNVAQRYGFECNNTKTLHWPH